MVWRASQELERIKQSDVYHVPMWEGDYMGFLRQIKLMDIFHGVGYADGEKKPSWALPGHGKAYGDCGKLIVLGCDHIKDHENSKVFGRYRKRSCLRKQCPTCYEGWASAEGERAIIRMATYVAGASDVEKTISECKKTYAKEPKIVFHKALVGELEEVLASDYVIHLVLSPPQDLKLEFGSDYEKLRKKAYRIAKEHGFRGGALIFHPYRLRCAVCHSTIPDYAKTCPQCHGSMFEWFWSPHFHGVGFGFIEGVKEGYSRHHWVIRNLGKRESVFATFQYLLSHAGVSIFHTTTWFGDLAYNVMCHVPKLGCVLELCPLCGRPLLPLKWIHVDDPPPFEFDEHDPYANEFLGDKNDWRVLQNGF